ncbi:MAG: octaprenyl diphosphate synthase [Deltaproteobacteria bacterium]|nr:MAG: octaprenyl diphosphate synthase [Deltaproteobacteria bacterium]
MTGFYVDDMRQGNNSMIQEQSSILDQFSPHFHRINEELSKVFDTHVPLIEEVGSYSLLGGGKRLRPLFFVLSCELCDYRDSDRYLLATIFECIHAASLLHDDVIDNASIRRGKTAANKVWSDPVAVLVGDFLFSKSSRIAAEKTHAEFLRVLAETATMMSEGQILEYINTHNWNMTRKQYVEIIASKTAALMSAACSCGAIVAGASQADIQSLRDFGRNMGIAFQIVDDIFDYTSTVERTGKSMGKDLREGKITLPLIYTLDYVLREERERLEVLFKNGNASEEDYTRIAELVRNNGAIGRCRSDAKEYADLAEQCLSPFPNSSKKESLLKLNQFIVNRNH